jgi:hypothetical protein
MVKWLRRSRWGVVGADARGIFRRELGLDASKTRSAASRHSRISSMGALRAAPT